MHFFPRLKKLIVHWGTNANEDNIEQHRSGITYLVQSTPQQWEGEMFPVSIRSVIQKECNIATVQNAHV